MTADEDKANIPQQSNSDPEKDTEAEKISYNHFGEKCSVVKE